eukprot:1491419-Alexandrium_andersonii.AAC.1
MLGVPIGTPKVAPTVVCLGCCAFVVALGDPQARLVHLRVRRSLHPPSAHAGGRLELPRSPRGLLPAEKARPPALDRRAG